jgi:hypothetical protein
MSFPDLVMQEASSLSNSIGMDQARLIETKVTEVEQGMEQPGSLNFHETLTFVVLYVILATVQAVVLMIIGFGLIAQAVLLLWGLSSFRSSLCPRWIGFSGAGSRRFFSIRFIKSLPAPSCTSLAGSCWRSLPLILAG